MVDKIAKRKGKDRLIRHGKKKAELAWLMQFLEWTMLQMERRCNRETAPTSQPKQV